jgi:uncharacterized lipoprotein YajG
MKIVTARYLTALAPLLLAAGCGLHSAGVNDPLPAAQLSQELQQSFQSADAVAREAVAKIVAETQTNAVAAAFTDVKELSAMPNLTQSQRVMAIRASHTISQQLQDAAQSGDEHAAETLHSYSASH